MSNLPKRFKPDDSRKEESSPDLFEENVEKEGKQLRQK